MILTLGHSNRTGEEFLSLLAVHGIRRLIDVRRYPVSRRFPHFDRSALRSALEAAGLVYGHREELGGRRDPSPRSRHRALEPVMRAYVEHLQGPVASADLDALAALSPAGDTAVMCAEADPARCHRSLLADALLARGIEVVHVLDASQTRPHRLHPAARIRDGRVIYDGTTLPLDLPGIDP